MDMLAALRLQIEWGADEALADAPVDRMAAAAVAAVKQLPQPASASRLAPPAQARPGGVARAQLVSMAANTTEALRQALASFTDCPLAATATNLVFSDGSAESGLVVVGDVPGDDEDRTGRPFAGAAGDLLDRMFASVGLTRAAMLMTNVVPWRPPGGRPPTEAEVQTCLPFLWRHLTLLRPRLVVTLGALPARVLTRRDDGIRRLRGRWADLAIPGLPATVPMLPMLHPSYLLQTPAAKREAWTDLLALRRTLDSL